MITDWDDAYTNMAYIPDGAAFPDRWARAAAHFRANLPAGCTATYNVPYGTRPRQSFDVFRPPAKAEGLTVFVHGGYWMKFCKDDWSHLAEGTLSQGWAFALVGYTLAPQIRIAAMVLEVSEAITKLAADFSGPIRLVGHSAGGHLVTRQICTDTSLSPTVMQRIAHVVSISGVHDLRPLLRTKMNATLQIDETESGAQSPALLRPFADMPLSCVVGADERPEFLRQTDLLANIWRGLGADITRNHLPKTHHFNVIDGLCDRDSELMRVLIPGA